MKSKRIYISTLAVLAFFSLSVLLIDRQSPHTPINREPLIAALKKNSRSERDVVPRSNITSQQEYAAARDRTQKSSESNLRSSNNFSRTPSLSPLIPKDKTKQDVKRGSIRSKLQQATIPKPFNPESRHQINQQIRQLQGKTYPEKHKDWSFDPKTDSSRFVQESFQRSYPNHRDWFNDRFFDRHHYRPSYYQLNTNWWGNAGWNSVSIWLSWDGRYRDGKDYPSGGYGAYYSEQPLSPVSQNQPFLEKWLPLGVYIVGQDETQVAYSPLFIQLALNQAGDIAGTFYNATTDQTYQLEGEIDKESRQAVWKYTDDKDSPWMVAKVYDLTQKMATVYVKFPDGRDQEWILVRLNE